VSRARQEPKIQVGEGLLDPFGPGWRLDRIELSPPHDGGYVYGGVLPGASSRMSFFFVLGPVPTEACPDCVGSGKSVYDRLELLRAHAVLVAHPAIVEVSQVQWTLETSRDKSCELREPEHHSGGLSDLPLASSPSRRMVPEWIDHLSTWGIGAQPSMPKREHRKKPEPESPGPKEDG
jgi:hypothetical protein